MGDIELYEQEDFYNHFCVMRITKRDSSDMKNPIEFYNDV